jgi:uncharacterized protein YlzI (FlbEa/FlbD family)
VIILTRLGNGMQIAVNPDLIERAEHTPDTVITLVDGHKLVVEESLGDVVVLIRAWRASVAADAVTLSRLTTDVGPHTRALNNTLHEDAALSDKAALPSPLGRILRLPAREV